MPGGFGDTILGGSNRIIRKSMQFVDVNGNTLFSMDSTGNLTGQVLSANNDIFLAGESLETLLGATFNPDPWHSMTLLNSWVSGIAGNAYPSYRKLTWDNNLLHVSGILTSASVVTSDAFAQLPAGYYNPNTQIQSPVVEVSGGAPKFLQVDTNGTLRISGHVTGDSYVINSLLPLDIPNNPVSGGGSNNKQTLTKTYNCTSTASYWNFSPNLRSTSVCYQGTEGSTSSQVAYIQWPAATIVSDLTGATINWAQITATNQHTWYNSGGTLDLGWASANDYSNGLHGADHPTVINQHFNEGQKLTFNVATSYVQHFLTGSMNYSLIGDGSTTDLNFYGYWAGGANSWQLTVNYTK